MRNDDLSRLETVVRGANPVSQPSDLVDSDESAAVALLIADGRRTMTTTLTPQQPGTEPRSARSRLAWAFAAALTLTMLIVGVVALLQPGSNPQVTNQTTTMVTTTSTAPTTTTEPTTPAGIAYPLATAEAEVAALYSAWNEGDVAGVVAQLQLDPSGPGDPSDAGYTRPVRLAIEGAEAKLKVECDPGTPTASEAVTIHCTQQIIEDLFYTPAGVTLTESVTWEVDETGITWIQGRPIWVARLSSEAREYLRAFDQWLFERRSDGMAAGGWIWVDPNNGLLPNQLGGDPCCPYSVETAAAAQRLFSLVPEFLSEPGDPWPVGREDTETASAPILLETDGLATNGIRNGEILFTLTHGPDMFADVDMAREPDGVLASFRPGWHSYVYHVHEFAPGNENSPGDYLQVEIHRLWPANEAIDVLWLTDYSGATRDILTGFPPSGPPPQSGSFTLLDALVLEGQLDRFGLHNDCSILDDGIGAALLSFEGDEPVPLMGWSFDPERRALVEVDDPLALDLGECLPPEPRS